MIKYDKRKFRAYQIPGVDEADFQTEDTHLVITRSEQRGKSLFKKCSICSRESTNLKECKYCKKLFCEVHIEPKHPQEFLESKVGHPCIPYAKEHPYVEQQNNKKYKNTKFKKNNREGWSILKRMKNRLI